VGRPKKYRTEAQRHEACRKRQRAYYKAHRETIKARAAERRQAERLRKRPELPRIPQTAGKAIEPQQGAVDEA
jgi:hypothetical protein